MRKPQPKPDVPFENPALAYVRADRRALRAFDDKDRALEQMLKEFEPGKVFDLGKLGKFVLKDAMPPGVIKVYRSKPFIRYELQQVK